MTDPEVPEPSSQDERSMFRETEDIVRAGLIFRGDHSLETKIAALIMEKLNEMGWRGPIRS